MWWSNYSQTLFWKIKIENISRLKAQSFKQFVFLNPKLRAIKIY